MANDKSIKQAKQMVEGAVSIFAKALNEVKQANSILLAANKGSDADIAYYRQQIALETESIIRTDAIIKENDELIAKLEKFV